MNSDNLGPETPCLDNIDCVDSHFHIWDLKKFEYPWPTSEDSFLYRNFTIDNYKQAVKSTPIKHSVFVQVVNNCVGEAEWACELVEENPVIKGIVAGIDVTDEHLIAHLDRLASRGKIVGVRHILDMEKDDWLTRNDVISGLKVLESRNIPFDLLLRPTLTKHIPELSRKLPKLRMVVDHCAKPYIREGKFDQWAKEMKVVAENPNIYCKISGLMTEADVRDWKPEHLDPYVKGSAPSAGGGPHTSWSHLDQHDACSALIGQFAGQRVHR